MVRLTDWILKGRLKGQNGQLDCGIGFKEAGGIGGS